MTTDFWLWNFLDLDPGPRGPVLFPRVMTTAHWIGLTEANRNDIKFIPKVSFIPKIYRLSQNFLVYPRNLSNIIVYVGG